uniref:Uncharacterized protein n=1 Tax=Melopsittacus undulatus TaxID=13146 RepID=A0A8V5FXU2_MELUD
MTQDSYRLLLSSITDNYQLSFPEISIHCYLSQGARSQLILLAHCDRNIIMPIIFSYESHHRPVLLWVIGIKCNEFLSTIFIQPIHLDGILQSISKEKHFHLHWKKTEIQCVKLHISFTRFLS